jgi:hypothetical protein
MAVSGLTLVSGVGIFVDTRDLVLCLLDRGLDIGFDGGC